MTTATIPKHTTSAAPRGERRITEFRPEDAAAVAEMFNGSNEGWPGGFDDGVPWTAEKVLRMQHDRAPLATFISWDGAAAAGYCSFYEYPAEPGEAGYVGLLNAATRFHGRGHGRDLLKAALQRCLDLDFRRVDLHTWQGNMKAVPLYKKSGYFWVPETAVHMENYLPALLRIPALADFWAEADWYQSQVRELTVREDRFLEGGMRVYPYEFRHGERYVKATIDATARGLTALETERWRLSCRVDDRRLIIGRPRRVTWEVENRTGQPMRLTLLASAAAGLRLHKEETVVVDDRYVADAELTADPAYQPPPPGQRGPRLESLLLLDGLPVRLETGVEIKPAVEIRLLPRRLRLLAGQEREVTLQAQNHLDEEATLTLRLAPSPGLTLPGADAPITTTLPPASYGGATVRLRADAAGAHTLQVRPTVAASGDAVAIAPLELPLPAVDPGGIVALEADAPTPFYAERDERRRELRLETATHRLVVELRGGGFHLEDAATGDFLAGGRLMAGPPFSWPIQVRIAHMATVEQRDGAATVRLRGATPQLPAAVVEHELQLAASGLLRLATAITNAGSEPLEPQAAVETWSGGNLETFALPTTRGLLVTDLPEFPDWGDPDLQRPDTFAEPWLAREGDGRVTGVVWADAMRIEVGGWSLAEVRQDAGVMAPGERRVLPPIYLYAGPGDRQTVRNLWRDLLAPAAPAHAPRARDVLALTGQVAASAIVAGASNRLTLSALTNRVLSGELRFEASPGWEIEPATLAVSGVRAGADQDLTIDVRQSAPHVGAVPVRASFRSDRLEQRVFDGVALNLGDHAGGVHVSHGAQRGQSIWSVDNGWLRFQVAPTFIGSVVALETLADGVNHLRSAYPEAREFGWMRPWFGGLYAAVHAPGRGHFPDAGRLDEETVTVEPAESPGNDGRVWRGVSVRSVLATRGLRGLALRAAYLTLPGSNLLALVLAVRNNTEATLPVDAALVAYLQPGGSLDDAELLLDPAGARRLRRAQRTIDMRAGDWVGVRNPRDGRTIAMVRGAADADVETHIDGLDWGALGAHAAHRASFRLPPHTERQALAYLILARDEEEAAAYRHLAGAGLL